jgi:cytochrome c oxidase subunit 2
MIPFIDEWLHRVIFRTLPGSETAAYTDALFMMIFWFSMFFFVLLMTLMVYWTIKYRRRPGVPAEVSPHHNTPLEILWTVIPSSGLLVIFVLGFWGYMSKVVPASGALELKVTANMWNWVITYPTGVQSTEVQPLNEDDIDYPVFYVPENTAIALRMSSQDVIHSFWIPDFRTKMDVYPNRFTGYTFRTPQLGASEYVTDISGEEPVQIPGRDMYVFCAEYCGDDHSRMAATLRVVPQHVYEEKLRSFESSGDPILDGKRLHAVRCASCHSVDGSPNTGPSWLNLYGSEGAVTVGGLTEIVVKDANYMRESIYVPNAKIVVGYAGNMPSFQGQLSEPQFEALLAYMRSISVHAGNPPAATDPDADTPAGPDAEAGDGLFDTTVVDPTADLTNDPANAPEPSMNPDGGER